MKMYKKPIVTVDAGLADKILFIEQILCRVQPNTPILYQI